MDAALKKQVQSLVQQVVTEYLEKQVEGTNADAIAILLNNPTSHSPEVILEAVTLLAEKYEVTMLVSEEWSHFQEKWKGESILLTKETSLSTLLEVIEKTKVLVIPVSSFHLLSKLALTMDDEMAAKLAIQYQLKGKPIVMAKDEVELDVYGQLLSPHSVQERIQGYIRQIQKDEVKWIALKDLLKTVDAQISSYSEKAPLLLSKHIEKAMRDGLDEIFLPAKSRVTPSAKDLARELNVKIHKKTDS